MPGIAVFSVGPERVFSLEGASPALALGVWTLPGHSIRPWREVFSLHVPMNSLIRRDSPIYKAADSAVLCVRTEVEAFDLSGGKLLNGCLRRWERDRLDVNRWLGDWWFP